MEEKANHKYGIGSIVTLKSHPLSYQKDGIIDMQITHIPPFMVIKEIHIDYKKKTFSDLIDSSQISDKVKYLCVYFNQREMKFEEKFLFESMLITLEKNTIIFNNASVNVNENYIKLIEETNNYLSSTYEYGKRVFFKTHKLENRKKFLSLINTNSLKNKGYKTHTSPAFILSGIKYNDTKDVYDIKTGKAKKLVSSTLYKVLWYNSYQEKISEQFLPNEFFVNSESIYKN